VLAQGTLQEIRERGGGRNAVHGGTATLEESFLEILGETEGIA
jgi:hypothetical protein